MKVGRFILNSDFCTLRNSGYSEISGTIANSVTVPAGQITTTTLGTATVGENSDSFSVLFSSSAYNYSTPGPICDISNGSSTIVAQVIKTGNSYALKVIFNNENGSSSRTFSGFGQTLTAKIHTYKDPFTD